MGKQYTAHRTLLFAAMTLLFAACAPLPMKDVEQKIAPAVRADAEQIPVKFSKVQIKVRRGTKIGRFYYRPLVCVEPFGDITWGQGRVSGRDIEFSDIFFEEMEAADYDVVGDPDRLFEQNDEMARAEYRIAGSIDEIVLNLCNKIDFFSRDIGSISDGYVKVKWQVYSNRQRKVVYSTSTEGRGKMDQASFDSHIVAIQNAFGSATANLAADPKLREILTRADVNADAETLTGSARAPGDGFIQIPKQKPYASALSGHINRLRNATVTIGTGDSFGSGFFISEDGLLITNNHVVGDSRFVQVPLISGREVTGEVLRRHKGRDVALVLVEGNGFTALPIREAPAIVSEEVFAIGTPRNRELTTTVSKGIVSAVRLDKRDGLERIQADVDIHGGNSGGPLLDASGNLIGISVAGYSSAGDFTKSSIGLNFFIPIADALARLKLEPADLPKNYSAVKSLSKIIPGDAD